MATINDRRYSALWRRLQEATPNLKETERSPYLERLCGVNQGSVSRWRTGKTELNTSHARAISEDTGYCAQYLFDGNGPKRWKLGSLDLNALTEILDDLDDTRRAEIVSIARILAKD